MRVNYPFVTERHKVLINSPSRKLWPPTSSYCEISRSQFLDLQNFKQCFSLIYHDDVFHKKQSFSFKKISFISVVIVGESVVFPPPPPPPPHTYTFLAVVTVLNLKVKAEEVWFKQETSSKCINGALRVTNCQKLFPYLECKASNKYKNLTPTLCALKRRVI